MYRLLFLFYIEARPELGYAPVDAEAYRKGYSLEHLRDLELVRLTGDESLNGYYIHESIQTLFRLIRDGFDGGEPNLLAGSLHNTFQIRPLDSALFRKNATPLLDSVKMRNETLQRVVRLMSLTRPAKGRNRRRGRISYAQLGINQLGAVYEALLSFRGFFAEEDLYEVKQAGKDPDELANAWFVPLRELDEYSQEERVFESNADGLSKLKVHRKGRFIYRLAGRDREKTASYYTPESLTKCVVKYALKELVPDDMPAQRILDLTICEPAMGSGGLPQRSRKPARGEVPGPPPARTRPAYPARGLRRRTAKGQTLHRRPQRVWRGPEPRCRGTRRSLAVAELHPQGRPCAMVRLPDRLRQLPGRCAAASVSQEQDRQAEESGALVQLRAGIGWSRLA